ncbi:hypothetical protein [Streptomyces sp. AC550_RSS872]|nr:hypothetical protein [Streptomyces sp. AC550_RSS872]
MTTTKAVRRRGISVLALALLVALPVVSAEVTVAGRGGPSVQVAVNGWQ